MMQINSVINLFSQLDRGVVFNSQSKYHRKKNKYKSVKKLLTEYFEANPDEPMTVVNLAFEINSSSSRVGRYIPELIEAGVVRVHDRLGNARRFVGMVK